LKVTVRIDEEHSMKLITGKTVSIRVPKDADVIELKLMHQRSNNTLAKVIDVFFNCRPA
jgi:hypothetical protein